MSTQLHDDHVVSTLTQQAMSGTTATLSRDETLKLYMELASNDEFRGLYERDPKAALIDLGIEPATLAAMSSICFIPARLAPKQEFQRACERIHEEMARVGQSMAIPSLKLDGRQH
jgi:putative modified peptide